ncbi:signal transducer [Phaffia rhodozyma]|uniref:Signal transducer n=1 Tax=Phaffia rhodozyma TaxID=264483 RepID=A0A0F7SYE6_PHARH|nr:signal transducer [Phaffia rhodozyma]
MNNDRSRPSTSSRQPTSVSRQSYEDYSKPSTEIPNRRRPDVSRKLVVVGDGGCGKTCLLTVYAHDRFPVNYVPTVFENFVTQVQYESKVVELALWDTAGQEDFDRLRPLSYNDTDVVLIVFACNHRPSLENVKDKWHPEISHFLENTPLLLVCAKIDLRTDPQTLALMAAQGTQPISRVEGEAVAREIGGKYFECSSKTGVGVKQVFEGALKESLKGKFSFGIGSGGSGGGGSGGGNGGRGKRKKGCVVL